MTPTTAQRIGRAVRVALIEQGRHQAELADVIGRTPQAVSQRLLGHVAFRSDELVQIAEFLGVPVSRFYEFPTQNGSAA